VLIFVELVFAADRLVFVGEFERTSGDAEHWKSRAGAAADHGAADGR